MKDIEQRKIFAKNLNHYLSLLQKSQKEVADAIGVSPQTFNTWCQAIALPRMGKVQRLADYFHIGKSDLIDGKQNVNFTSQGIDNLTPEEIDHIERYRNLDESGKKHTDYVLEREMERVKALKKEVEEKERQAARIAELEAAQAPTDRRIIPFIDLQPHISNMSHMVGYFRSASAGDGVFIMGSEGTEQVRIPDVPGVHEMDYVIKISGTSMEPDYHDEDVVLVSRTAEMHYGDVGIFVINGKAYIKEYGKYELISRNPESPNIKISEYDNIVCMGKVVGRIREEDMIKV